MKHPTNFWYSKLQDAHTCLKKYQYIHIDELIPQGDLSGDLEFGSAIHMGLYVILQGQDGVSPFKIYWESIKEREDIQWGRNDWETLYKKGLDFLEKFQDRHLKNYEPMSLEKRLYYTDPNNHIGLEGTPDCVGKFKGKLAVIDFKTSQQPYDKNKIIVNEQMYIYAHLAEKALGLPIEKLVYQVFVKYDGRIQTIEHDLDRKTLDKTIQNVYATCMSLVHKQSIAGKDEFYKNTNSCIQGTRKCPFWEKCHGN